MGHISAETHEFRRENVPPDGTCLFWSALFVYKLPFGKIFNEDLRIRVADYIRNDKDKHQIVLNSIEEGISIEEYCFQIERGKLWGGDPELRALSILFETLICKLSIRKGSTEAYVWALHYGEDNPLATKYVFILHDEEAKHFDPLYLVNKQDQSKIETIFDPNDNTVNGLLDTFIRDKLKCKNSAKLGVNIPIDVVETVHSTDDSNQIEEISNLIRPNVSTKRNRSELDDIVSPANNNKEVPTSILEKYDDPNKRLKTTEDASDQISAFHKNNSESLTIEQFLQADLFADGFTPFVNQQGSEDPTMLSNDEQQKEKTNLENSSVDQFDDEST